MHDMQAGEGLDGCLMSGHSMLQACLICQPQERQQIHYLVCLFVLTVNFTSNESRLIVMVHKLNLYIYNIVLLAV